MYDELDPQPDPATTLRISKLQTGLGEVQSQLDEGLINPVEASHMGGAIRMMLTPLLAQQKALGQAAMLQARQRQMEDNAHAKAMQQADSAYDADTFHTRTAERTDPLTGQTASFYQRRPGDWEQIDYGEPSAPETPVTDVFPGTTLASLGMGTAAEAPAAPPPEATGDSHTMTIMNGEHRQTFRFDRTPEGGWSAPVKTYDNRPEGGSAESGGVAVTPGERAVLRQRVISQNIAGAEPQRGNFGPPGTHGDVAFFNEHRRWVGAVNAATDHLAQQLFKERSDRAKMEESARKQSAVVEESKRKEQVRADALAKRNEYKQDFGTHYVRILKELKQERKNILKENQGDAEKLPGYLLNDTEMEKYAEIKAKATVDKIHEHTDKKFGGGSGEARASNGKAVPQENAAGGGANLGGKPGQQQAFNELLKEVSAPRPTPKPAPKAPVPFSMQEYMKRRVGKFE